MEIVSGFPLLSTTASSRLEGRGSALAWQHTMGTFMLIYNQNPEGAHELCCNIWAFRFPYTGQKLWVLTAHGAELCNCLNYAKLHCVVPWQLCGLATALNDKNDVNVIIALSSRSMKVSKYQRLPRFPTRSHSHQCTLRQLRVTLAQGRA